MLRIKPPFVCTLNLDNAQREALWRERLRSYRRTFRLHLVRGEA